MATVTREKDELMASVTSVDEKLSIKSGELATLKEKEDLLMATVSSLKKELSDKSKCHILSTVV
jgi:predicted nuclease with TOPRIM domain